MPNLPLTRRPGERIVIDSAASVKVVKVGPGDRVKIEVSAPKCFSVDRGEIHQAKIAKGATKSSFYQLVALSRETLRRQKKFFRSKSREDMEAAMDCEKALLKMLDEIESTIGQQTFDFGS